MRKKSMIRILTKGITAMSCCLLVWGFTACADKWDEHYEEMPAGLSNESLWEAISSNPDLTNFKTLIAGVGYDKQLASSQMFTVFAPTNDCLSAAEVANMIALYKSEKGKVSEDENQVLKEFVKNHIALYNHSVSSVSNDSIKLMNGKYGVLTPNTIAGVDMLSKNQNYKNGVLYTVGSQLSYKPNLFELIRKDADLTKLSEFMYNPSFYYKVFIPEESVEGGLDDYGRTIYLDSVFSQRNELFSYLDNINHEDSSYWMVAPTDALWDQLMAEYSEYFKYPADCKIKDSLEYILPRLAIMNGTVFNRTFNTGVFNQEKASEKGAGDITIDDSLMSVNCIRDFVTRKRFWGGQAFNYYEYYNAWQSDGVLANTLDIDSCSNGLMRKATAKWPIDKLQSFAQYVLVEADANIWELSKTVNSAGDSIATISAVQRSASRDTLDEYNFYDRVWNNGFVEFDPVQNRQNHTATFRIDNVLSNFGYDIYLVTAPAIAYDRNAPEAQRVPTKLRITLNYKQENGSMKTERLVSEVATDANSMGYIQLASDFKFPVTNYGLYNYDTKPSVTLDVETRVSNSELNRGTFTRNMRIDCILLVPHGTMEEGVVPAGSKIPTDDQGKPAMLMKPHGDTPQATTFYMRR